ncbi:MAG: alpha-glucan family phosphorylase [Bacteroidota bacterium]|nr:alpha-glucan family phosphorylase [Bacteroidota bacterium]
MLQFNEIFTYPINQQFNKSVAYFSMEFAIDQSLKNYSGGLGFLAGSHMRSVYDLQQNVVGIGLLWKYGYYDQARNADQTLRIDFIEKNYHFLTDTNIIFPLIIHDVEIKVKAYLLKPEVFGTAPIFLLSTDIPENDHISQTITHRLYDANEATRIAQSIVLGAGGVKLLEVIGLEREVYHMNEGHGLPLIFSLFEKYRNIDDVKKRVAFTTHTPEKAGNESHNLDLLHKMSFFGKLDLETIKNVFKPENDTLDYTLTALRGAKIANAVSKLHGEVSNDMWASFSGICKIDYITNAQNKKFWKDDVLEIALANQDSDLLIKRKKELKKVLFYEVSNQCGKLFDPEVLTMVWARRFAGYKRADLIMNDTKEFFELINNSEYPIQIIWAGKPYPEDYYAINIFNDLIRTTKKIKNCAVLIGYELGLSAMLKKGSDLWLNNPVLTREASGTSGMTAAMNASINLSIPDGWMPEFAKHGHNCFVVPNGNEGLPYNEMNKIESQNIIDVLEKEALPMYYNDRKKWNTIAFTAMQEVVPEFDSGRMATEYYQKIYNY